MKAPEKVVIGGAELWHGDCLDTMRAMADSSVDSIVTDPPYGLGFMGKAWDHGVPSVEIWREALRVLKPGGHLLAFAGTRTQHRMACNIEDAGFEIRDMIAWVYGSGFPKSLDVSKAIDKAAGAEREVIGNTATQSGRTVGAGTSAGFHGGIVSGHCREITAPATDKARQWQGWGTALKPALETVTVARKPLIGTVAANVLAHGTGGLNIDGCRVQLQPGESPSGSGDRRGSAVYAQDEFTRTQMANGGNATPEAGRWPANLIHDGSEEVLAGFPETTTGGGDRNGAQTGEFLRGVGDTGIPRVYAADKGSAARFFYKVQQDDSLPREGGYDGIWQDQNPAQSSAPTAAPSSSLQSVLDATVQNAAAIWPSLVGILSSDSTGLFTSATPSESKLISEAVTAAILPIAFESSHESLHEKRSPCGSHASVVATKSQTGITTITASLYRSGGFVARATSSITPTSLDRGAQVSRFNYCAKASKKDRGADNTHPTVKPTDLMRYLCRLATPPGGVVLDPFMGSGSTGKAAVLEGFRFIGCELSAEYLGIAEARIARAQQQGQKMFAPEPIKQEQGALV